MRLIAPYPRHPLLWALVDLCGETMNSVAQHANLAKTTIHRLDAGYSPNDSQQRSLHRLLVQRSRDLPLHVPPVDRSPKAVRAYRRALFDVIAQVLADFPETPISDPHERRETMLESDVLAAVGEGRRRLDVMDALRRAYRPASIRRCARRIDVRSEKRPDGVWWLPPLGREPPPPADITPQFDRPIPLPRQPKSRRAREIADAVSIYLGRQPDFCAPGPQVVTAVQAKVRDASRSSIYRIARMMRLTRDVSGFGKMKRSMWVLPPVPPPDDAPDDDALDDDEDNDD